LDPEDQGEDEESLIFVRVEEYYLDEGADATEVGRRNMK
jgi:hypothetical protein